LFKVEYDIILYEFPKREIKKINKKSLYYGFKGCIIQKDSIIECQKISFSKTNFDNAFLQNKVRGVIEPGKNIKINLIRKSFKELCIISMESV